MQEYGYHHIGMLQHTPSGRPAFMHRTSFNSKFFPDCVSHKDEEYCMPEFISVPLSNDRATKSLQRNMYAWHEHHIDTESHRKSCKQAPKEDLEPSPVQLDELCGFDPLDVSVPFPTYPLARYKTIFDPHDAIGAAFAMYIQLKREIEEQRTPIAGLS